MGKLESSIESDIREYVIANGGNIHKLDAEIEPSIPDRIVLFPNCFPVYLEIKQERGAIRPGQKKEISSLRKRGYRVHIVRSLAKAKEILNGYSDIKEFIENYVPVKEKSVGKYKLRKR